MLRRNYFKNWVNWFECIHFLLSIIFASNHCPRAWQWQIGILSVFLSWISLIILTSHLPRIGIYVLMFMKIFNTFLEVATLSTLLVLTFAFTFYMTFYDIHIQVSTTWLEWKNNDVKKIHDGQSLSHVHNNCKFRSITSKIGGNN